MGMEPVGDLIIQSSELHGIEIPQSLIANSIDAKCTKFRFIITK